MSAFFFFDNLKVKDPQALALYAKKVPPIVAHYGGQYRALGGETTMVEGHWYPTYPVIIEFETVEQAKNWYHSEEYQPMKQLRQSAVLCNGVLIEGLPGNKD